MRTLPSLLLLLAAGLPAALPLRGAERVQAIDAKWRTITTAHYRIHYPDQPEFRRFAEGVASRIEGIHGLFQEWIGNTRAETTDVVIQNPLAMANGMTLTFARRPHVVLWIQPPESDSELAHTRDWEELLVTHELAHLHHLTLPDRKPRLIDRLPNPLRQTAIATKCPGWVAEGYATLLEGRLTGLGRPHGTHRALILRERARAGKLPTYQALDEIDYSLLEAPRYMVGSAFLEWLERGQAARPKVLQELWKRMASSRYPHFPEAFRATFGLMPGDAYQRFCAELTHDALEHERQVQAVGVREGELWSQVEEGFLGDLSVSPDGTRLLGQVLTQKEPGLRIWDLKAPLEAEKGRAKAAKRDPELPLEAPDVRPVREAEHRLGSVQFMLPTHPAWGAGGEVRYEVLRADSEGVFHWRTDTWKPLHLPQAAPSIQTLRPHMEKDGWGVEVGGHTLKLPFEPFGPLSWDQPRGLLYGATERQGIFTLVRLSFDPKAEHPFGEPQILTRTVSGAGWPAPTPDGKHLFFALLTARGSQIRKLDLSLPPLDATPIPAIPTLFAPGTVLAAADEASRIPAPIAPPASHPYGVAESHETQYREGVLFSPSGRSLLLGAGGSDILGRMEWVALGSVDFLGGHGMGPRGAMAGATWRGWAWHPSLQGFSVLERPSAQLFTPVAGWDRERRGAELSLARSWSPFPFGGGLKLSVAQEQVAFEDGRAQERRVAFGRLDQRAAFNRGQFTLTASASAQGALARTEGATWNLQRAALALSSGYGWASFTLRGEAGRIQGSPTPLDRFHLGGQASDLVPMALEANRIYQPALPVTFAGGDRYSRWRAEGLGLFYVEGTSLWNAGEARSAYQRVAGMEVQGDLGESLILGDVLRRVLGRLHLRLGVHRPLDGPMKDRTVFTLAETFRF